jgi:two-component system, NarL family, nitrate/nitrite response regulator NarL
VTAERGRTRLRQRSHDPPAVRVRVFIVADIRVYRDGLAHVLGRAPGLEVVGTAAEGDAAVRALADVDADIVLLDMAMPDSLATLRELLGLSPPCKVVALAVHDAEGDLLACAEAGASGYVTRDDSLESMIEALESVARGELLTTPRIAALLFERVSALTSAAAPRGEWRLTRRELEIVRLIDDGLSNKAIAQRLHIELPTVKNHVHNILEKLHVHRRSDAVALLRAAPRD